MNFSRRIRESLAEGKRGRDWESVVGYALDDLTEYLEARFKPGMTWGNYGKWHIDHVRPIASFDFASEEDPELKECWALGNLQPLWAIENIRKKDRQLGDSAGYADNVVRDVESIGW